jgi:hypothetical protein
MSDIDELVKEFEMIRKRYYELYAKLVEANVPGVIDEVGASCDTGTKCHGGGDISRFIKELFELPVKS